MSSSSSSTPLYLVSSLGLLMLALSMGCDKKKPAPDTGADAGQSLAPRIEKPYARSAAQNVPSFQQIAGCIPKENRKKTGESEAIVIAAEAYLGLRPCFESISARGKQLEDEELELLVGTRDVFTLLGDPVKGGGDVRLISSKDDGAIDSLEWSIQAESSDEAFKGAFSTVLDLYKNCGESRRRAAFHGEAANWAEDQDEQLQSLSDVIRLLMDGSTTDGFAVLCEDEARHIVQFYVLDPVPHHNGEIALRRTIAYSVDAQDRVVDLYESLSNLRAVDPNAWTP